MYKKILAVFIGLTLASSALANNDEYLRQELERLKKQVETLTAMVEQNQKESEETKKTVVQNQEAMVQAQEVAEQTMQMNDTNTKMAAVVDKLSKVSLGGYGEHHLEMIRNSESDQIDTHRYVLFLGYEFNDKISFQSEFEVEHGVAGDDQPGEVEIEQAYINYKLNENHDVKLGQFLIPVGFINERHEPDTFYGVERPRLTNAIIPATWWETGVMASGRIGETLSYNAAVHSGLNLNNDNNGLNSIRSGRQKSAKASANSAAYTAGIDYTPMPGVTVGVVTNYQADMTQSEIDDDNVDGLLTEVHAEIKKGPFGLRAVYGNWDIDTSINAVEEQDGYYVEGSYKVSPKFGIFARYSEMEYANDRTGGGVTTGYQLIEEDNVTVGANYWLHPQVVLKADYQWRETDRTNYDITDTKTDKITDEERDSFNLGIGWSF